MWLIAAAMIAAGGCATQQSIEERARLACEDRAIPEAEMAACIEETEEVIRRALEYDPSSPRPR